jgi:type II secretory pathway pseudopilin PulG
MMSNGFKLKPPMKRVLGFSLVELSVALAISGVVGLLIMRWIDASRVPADRAAIAQDFAQAQQSIEAFVLRSHRLPCASDVGLGRENCASTTATELPWKTLGLASRFAVMRYGVARASAIGSVDLAALPAASIAPDLNQTFSDIPTTPEFSVTPVANSAAPINAGTSYAASITAAAGRRTSVNGLDWCHGLRQWTGGRVPGGLAIGNAVDSVSVAYALAHPGLDGVYAGSNAVARAAGAGAAPFIDLPARIQSVDYDDWVLAVGGAELLAKVGCTKRVAEALSSAQAAFAAYDHIRLIQQHWILVDTDVETASDGVADATLGVAMAALGLALGVTAEALAITSALNTEGLTAFQIVIAAGNLALATAQTVVAGVDLGLAVQAFVDAKAKRDATNTYVTTVYQQAQAALDRAILVDQKGLNP